MNETRDVVQEFEELVGVKLRDSGYRFRAGPAVYQLILAADALSHTELADVVDELHISTIDTKDLNKVRYIVNKHGYKKPTFISDLEDIKNSSNTLDEKTRLVIEKLNHYERQYDDDGDEIYIDNFVIYEEICHRYSDDFYQKTFVETIECFDIARVMKEVTWLHVYFFEVPEAISWLSYITEDFAFNYLEQRVVHGAYIEPSISCSFLKEFEGSHAYDLRVRKLKLLNPDVVR